MITSWRQFVGVVVLVLLGSAFAASPGQEVPGQILVGEQATGEPCLVCGKPVAEGQDGIVIRYQGRPVYLHGSECPECLEGWVADPDRHFSARQARAALFDEGPGSGAERKMSGAWLYFGLYVLVGVLFGGVCSYLAVTRGHPPLPWFGLGLLLNVVGLVALLTRGAGDQPAVAGVPAGLRKVPSTHLPRPCSCGAENHPSASACSSCGAALEPTVESEVTRS